ncbi:MAG: acyl-CoA dehydrogenase family protein, partial [Proteobacteria bacterium]|nr:acyl-CoA dehydrogenase family protein [Pseudomonadota bacterium]
MDHQLSEEHQLIRQTIRDFALREIKPVALELDEKEEFSIKLTQRMGEMGLMGITVPEKYGGHGLDYLAYCIALEEVARIDGSQAATLT